MKSEQPEQSLEHQLKMARPRRSEVKRVPLSEKEKEFLGKIMHKAVAAEKAGELHEALGFYTDYKNELGRIKEKKENSEEMEWVMKQFFLFLQKALIYQFLSNEYNKLKQKAKNIEKEAVFEFFIEKSDSYRNDKYRQALEIADIEEIKDKFWEKFGIGQNDDLLKVFDVSDEEMKKVIEMSFSRISPKDFAAMSDWQINPEIRKEIEEMLKKNDRFIKKVEEEKHSWKHYEARNPTIT